MDLGSINIELKGVCWGDLQNTMEPKYCCHQSPWSLGARHPLLRAMTVRSECQPLAGPTSRCIVYRKKFKWVGMGLGRFKVGLGWVWIIGLMEVRQVYNCLGGGGLGSTGIRVGSGALMGV